MAVLAASICTRGGKPLLSRQFRDLSKDRITALLANLPSLISNSSSQHTSVEDEHVRYVYQPLEEFYVVLITNKTSNILQDIDTLHLFVSTVSNMLRNIDDIEIFDNSFEIISAFDEIINLGYKENLTLSQIETFLQMDSHEEKIQEIIERNKELEATEERKRRAKEIQRKELAKRNLETVPSYDSFQTQQSQSYQPSYNPPVIESQQQQTKSSLSSKPISARGGLQLGKKTGRPGNQTESAQPLLTNHQPIFQHTQASHSQPTSYPVSQSTTPVPVSSAPKVPNNGILITINEKITASLSREGSIESSEIKGDLQLRINKPEYSNSKILLKTEKSKNVQYKTHPKVDRNLFTSANTIGLKDQSSAFPSNDNALGVLRWRVVGKQEDTTLVPLVLTAWVSMGDSGIANVTLEYDLTGEFVSNLLSNNTNSIDDVKILVPIASADVNLTQGDDVSYEVTEEGVVFTIASITGENPNGSFEFTIPANDEDAVFPIQLQFEVNNTNGTESDTVFGKVQVIDVVSNDEDEQSLPFDLHLNISSEGYDVN
jgi:hypothetical protein